MVYRETKQAILRGTVSEEGGRLTLDLHELAGNKQHWVWRLEEPAALHPLDRYYYLEQYLAKVKAQRTKEMLKGDVSILRGNLRKGAMISPQGFAKAVAAGEEGEVQELRRELVKHTFELLSVDQLKAKGSDAWATVTGSYMLIKEVWSEHETLFRLRDHAMRENDKLQKEALSCFREFEAAERGADVAAMAVKDVFVEVPAERLQGTVVNFVQKSYLETLEPDLYRSFELKHGIDTEVGSPAGDASFKILLDNLNVQVLYTVACKMDYGFHEAVKGALAPLLEKYKGLDDGVRGYYRGPVKGAERMTKKLSEYEEDGEKYPRAACIIDPIRGTLCFDTAAEVFDAVELIKDKFTLLRIKNKFKVDENGFRNVMVNLYYTENGVTIIGELQITTYPFLKIKKVQHKLYSIVRAFPKNWDGKTGAEEIYDTIKYGVCGAKRE